MVFEGCPKESPTSRVQKRITVIRLRVHISALLAADLGG
jgi:hypothetical protein